MKFRRTILATGVALAVTGCAGSTHQGRSAYVAAADCTNLKSDRDVADLYAPNKVHKVEPIYREVFVARALQPRYVSGANVYVAAEPELHPAYVERLLSCHAAAGGSRQAHDLLQADGIQSVNVTQSGPSVRITISGVDRASGEDIWRRAQAIEQRRGRVTVEQLSSAAPSGSEAL